MKKGILVTIIFSLILVLAFLVRFYKLGQAPAGLYLDEAAQGYSAYSILKTGKDEFGKPLPIVFRSFTDFKTPVYIYLIVPLIPFFDLTPFSVRLPSFIFSILTLPIFYLLIRELALTKHLTTHYSLRTTHYVPPLEARALPALASLLLAISPWHILFSRTNFETNVALFFFLAGIYTFYLGLQKPKLLLLSAVMFAIAIPAYHSQRLVTPAMMLLFFLRFRKELLLPPLRRYLLMGAVIGLIISLPTLSVATTPGFLARAAGLNIFSQARQQPAGFIEGYHGTLHWLVNGSWFLTTREFASLYVSYFSPRNMFVLGDSGPRSSFPELAPFLVWQFPFYLYGLYILIKKKSLGELRFLTLVLLLIAPIPAAVTRDPYSTIRAENMVIPQLIIIALGMLAAFSTFKVKSNLNNLKGWVGIGILLLLVIYSVAKLYSSVFILNEHFRAKYWNYGWEEVAKIIKNEFDPNLSIIVDNARGEPYSQLLFFLKFDPQTYQEENFEVPRSEYYTNMNRNTTKKIGNITTRPINWEKDLLVEQYLVGDELSISKEQIKRHNLDLISEITYPDKSVAFRLIKTNP